MSAEGVGVIAQGNWSIVVVEPQTEEIPLTPYLVF